MSDVSSSLSSRSTSDRCSEENNISPTSGCRSGTQQVSTSCYESENNGFSSDSDSPSDTVTLREEASKTPEKMRRQAIVPKLLLSPAIKSRRPQRIIFENDTPLDDDDDGKTQLEESYQSSSRTELCSGQSMSDQAVGGASTPKPQEALNAEDYEVSSQDRESIVPSRLPLRVQRDLFDGFAFVCARPFRDFKQEQLEDLLLYNGAVIKRTPKELSPLKNKIRICIVGELAFYGKELNKQQLIKQCRGRCITVHYHWLEECLLCYHIRPTDKYIFETLVSEL